ncbi:MAG: hypothetical protein ABIY55_30340, partial [Kofleriaceae bacterium]
MRKVLSSALLGLSLLSPACKSTRDSAKERPAALPSVTQVVSNNGPVAAKAPVAITTPVVEPRPETKPADPAAAAGSASPMRPSPGKPVPGPKGKVAYLVQDSRRTGAL